MVQALSGEDSQPMITNVSKRIFVVLASLGKIHQKKEKKWVFPKSLANRVYCSLCFLNVLFKIPATGISKVYQAVVSRSSL